MHGLLRYVMHKMSKVKEMSYTSMVKHDVGKGIMNEKKILRAFVFFDKMLKILIKYWFNIPK